jgi:hypothetical protein
MARNVLSRHALRQENDAAEEAEKATGRKSVKKKAAPRSRTTKIVRLKSLWGVFNVSMRRIAVFEHNERNKADKKASQLTEKTKKTHFVQCIKEAIEE